MKKKLFVVIPAYQPTTTLTHLVLDIAELTIPDVDIGFVLVDDGSTGALTAEVFEQCAREKRVTVLRHSANKGKGAALKTALAHIVAEAGDNPNAYVVTADADGQHLPADIIKVAQASIEKGKTAIGVREFSESVPARSRFGNILTRKLFALIFSTDVPDTQSGLRAFPVAYAKDLIDINYDRYHYELEALVRLSRMGEIAFIPIETVYEPGNPTSHFNPFLDSLRIYWVLSRYVSASFLIGISDIIFFTILVSVGIKLLVALIVSRTIATIIYFMTMKNFVFKSRTGSNYRKFIYFLALVLFNFAVVSPMVWVLNVQLGVNATVALIVANSIMYVSNFLWQSRVIFKN